ALQPQSGYKWKTLYREDVRTVAVPIFTTKSFHQGVEFQLTKAIVTQIEAMSPYKVVDRDRADTILEGEIVDVRTRTVSRDRDSAVPQEQIQGIVVNFVWKDLRTGKILQQKYNFEESKVFYPTLAESQFTGTQSSVENLAVSIVHEMQADW
ncbi:MAG TPA: LPS assembly lipoprotein LptE, partial [Roseimicrobium sp.]|nr:LPS assembly lipoprotein LptE [Roseimicrobium sp.]